MFKFNFRVTPWGTLTARLNIGSRNIFSFNSYSGMGHCRVHALGQVLFTTAGV